MNRAILFMVCLIIAAPVQALAASDHNLRVSIESLERENSRLALDTYRILSEEDEDFAASGRLLQGSIVTGGAIGAGIGATLTGSSLKEALGESSAGHAGLEVVVIGGIFVALAGTTLYLAALAGNASGVWDFVEPEGSLAGVASTVGVAANFFAAYFGYALSLWGGPNPLLIAGAVGTTSAGSYLGYRAIQNFSSAGDASSEKTASLNPEEFLEDDFGAALNAAATRTAHLLRIDKQPKKVAKVKELIADLSHRRPDADLYREIADLTDDMGEPLVAESLAFSASELSQQASASLPALKKKLPKEVSLQARADAGLKLLRTRIADLEKYSKGKPTAQIAKIIRDAKRTERKALVLMELI